MRPPCPGPLGGAERPAAAGTFPPPAPTPAPSAPTRRLPGRAAEKVSKFTVIRAGLQIFGRSGIFAPPRLPAGPVAMLHRRWLPAGSAPPPGGRGAGKRGGLRPVPLRSPAGPAGLARSRRDPRSPAPSGALGPVRGWRPAGRGGDLGGQPGLPAPLCAAVRCRGLPCLLLRLLSVRHARRSCPPGTGQPEPGHPRASGAGAAGRPPRREPGAPRSRRRQPRGFRRAREGWDKSAGSPRARIKRVNLTTGFPRNAHTAISTSVGHGPTPGAYPS